MALPPPPPDRWGEPPTQRGLRTRACPEPHETCRNPAHTATALTSNSTRMETVLRALPVGATTIDGSALVTLVWAGHHPAAPELFLRPFWEPGERPPRAVRLGESRIG